MTGSDLFFPKKGSGILHFQNQNIHYGPLIMSFWISRSFDLGDLDVLRMDQAKFFKNYIFEISAFKGKK